VLLALAYAAKDNSGNIGGSFDIMTMDGGGKLKFEHYEPSDLDPPFTIFDKNLGRLLINFTLSHHQQPSGGRLRLWAVREFDE
jgi:hypothetical protein